MARNNLDIQNYFLQKNYNSVQRSQRAELVKKIEELLNSGQEQKHTKIANWKRYVQWLKDNKVKDGEPYREMFRQSKSFLKPLNGKSLYFLLSHIPTDDLFYVKSVLQDRENRKEALTGYLIWSIKKK